MASINNDDPVTSNGDYKVRGHEAGKLHSFLVEGVLGGATVTLQWRKKRPTWNAFDDASLTRTAVGGSNFAIDTPYLNVNVAGATGTTNFDVSITTLSRT